MERFDTAALITMWILENLAPLRNCAFSGGKRVLIEFNISLGNTYFFDP